MSAPVLLALTIILLGRLTLAPTYRAWAHPILLMPVMGNLIAAMVAPLLFSNDSPFYKYGP